MATRRPTVKKQRSRPAGKPARSSVRKTSSPKPRAAASQQIHLHNRVHRPLAAQPITYGTPWPRGAVKDADQLVLLDEENRRVPAAFSVLNRWEDGSVQWSLVDAGLDFTPSQDRTLTIRTAKAVAPGPAPRHAVEVACDEHTARVSNGLVSLAISTRPGELVTNWNAVGKPLIDTNGFDVSFKDDQGKLFSVTRGPRTLSLEVNNPLRVVVRLDGRHGAGDGSQLLDYFMRFEIRAGRADVKITHSFRNRELPTPGIQIADLNAVLKTTVDPAAKRCFTANNLTRHYLTACLRIDEDPEIVASDTGDIDHYTTAHKSRARADCFVRDASVLHDPPENKPWFLRDPKFRLQAGGNKCVWPYLALVGGEGGVLCCIDTMTSLYPKSLRSQGSTLHMGLWPSWAGPLSITQGAGRSHTLHVGPLRAGVSDEEIQNQYLSWEFGGVHSHVPSTTTLEISPDLEHVRRCSVFAIDKLPAYEPDKHYLFERKVLDAWIGVSYGQLGAVDQVQPWIAAGFWDYGDHHLANNEEMHALVYLQNYLRTGNWGCAEYGLATATHIMEVDHCAFSVDHFQNGGQIAHCMNHNDGAAYPSHMWFTELLFAYVLTGDIEYKRTAMRICENLLHWIDDPEGFAIISADQREAGQPMINLTWCYQFTRDQRYLDACWKIVRQYLMANTQRLGRMLDEKPIAFPVKVCSYGDYAAIEGMYWLWEITRDRPLRAFMLSQLEWRVHPRYCGVHGFHRTTDYNPAAYAFYLTGDKKWLTRVAKPFRAAFRAAKWPLGWVHAMYFTKLAFDYSIVTDDDIMVQ